MSSKHSNFKQKSPSICKEAISIPMCINWCKLKLHWKLNWKINEVALTKDNCTRFGVKKKVNEKKYNGDLRKASICSYDQKLKKKKRPCMIKNITY